MDQLRFVKSVDGLGQGVVIAVAPAADRRLDTGFCQLFRISDGDLLRFLVGVMSSNQLHQSPIVIDEIIFDRLIL